MGFTVDMASLEDVLTESRLRLLIEKAFNAPGSIPTGRLAKNIQSNASRPSFFLVAREQDQIIGCNAFIANDFELEGKNYTGYQSCWTATDPDHRGKGIFAALIGEAKKQLLAEGAGFIYGIPNDTSRPIFVNKFGFTEIPSLRTTIPGFSFLSKSYINNTTLDHTAACRINEAQVMQHKVAQGLDIRSYHHNKSWIWGKCVSKKKWGFTIPVFEMGGMEIDNADDLRALILQLLASCPIKAIQVLAPATHSVRPLLNGWRTAAMNPFIFYNLAIPGFDHFDLMLGSVDVY